MKREPSSVMQTSQWSIRSGSKAIWVSSGRNWFEGLTITLEEDGNTLLTGPVVDQAALHGLLEESTRLGNAIAFGKFR